MGAYEDDEDNKYEIDEDEEEEEFDDDSNALICSCTLGNSTVMIETKDERDRNLCGKEDTEEEEEVEDVEPVQITLVINLKNSGFTDGATPRIKIMDQDPEEDLDKKEETKEAVNEDMEREEKVIKTKKSLLQYILTCFTCCHKPRDKS